MSRLSRPAIRRSVHQALAARVRLLLGQTGFDELMDAQLRTAQALARGAWPWHGKDPGAGMQALAQAVLDAFGLDPVYYGGSSLDFIISEGLAAAGVEVAELIRGHEHDSLARWQAEVVPGLDRVEDFVVAVFDGSWARGPQRARLGAGAPA